MSKSPDCKKQGKVYIHKAIVDKGSIKTGDVIKMSVEKEKRSAIAIHHSSTHLVHAALRAVLGDHVQQKGSLVDENKLRFDFSHTKPLTREEITKWFKTHDGGWAACHLLSMQFIWFGFGCTDGK